MICVNVFFPVDPVLPSGVNMYGHTHTAHHTPGTFATQKPKTRRYIERERRERRHTYLSLVEYVARDFHASHEVRRLEELFDFRRCGGDSRRRRFAQVRVVRTRKFDGDRRVTKRRSDE